MRERKLKGVMEMKRKNKLKEREREVRLDRGDWRVKRNEREKRLKKIENK